MALFKRIEGWIPSQCMHHLHSRNFQQQCKLQQYIGNQAPVWYCRKGNRLQSMPFTASRTQKGHCLAAIFLPQLFLIPFSHRTAHDSWQFLTEVKPTVQPTMTQKNVPPLLLVVKLQIHSIQEWCYVSLSSKQKYFLKLNRKANTSHLLLLLRPYMNTQWRISFDVLLHCQGVYST